MTVVCHVELPRKTQRATKTTLEFLRVFLKQSERHANSDCLKFEGTCAGEDYAKRLDGMISDFRNEFERRTYQVTL